MGIRGRGAGAIGRRGEEIAAHHLLKKGYSIIERNFRTRQGEVDIVAQSPDGQVVFVEVKSRGAVGFGLPEEAVDRRKQHRICKAALAFLQRHGWLDRPARLDVMAVSWQNGGQAQVRHIEDAFPFEGW